MPDTPVTYKAISSSVGKYICFACTNTPEVPAQEFKRVEG